MLALESMTEQSSQRPEVTIIPAEGHHIAELKSNLRQEDADEMLKLGVNIQHTMWQTFKHARTRKVALIDGKVAAFWGLHGMIIDNVGVPFLMTSPLVHEVSPLKFARIYQAEVYEMLNVFKKLENWVDASYTSSIRMLEIIGFTLHDPEPKGINRALYRRFEILRK